MLIINSYEPSPRVSSLADLVAAAREDQLEGQPDKPGELVSLGSEKSAREIAKMGLRVRAPPPTLRVRGLGD